MEERSEPYLIDGKKPKDDNRKCNQITQRWTVEITLSKEELMKLKEIEL